MCESAVFACEHLVDCQTNRFWADQNDYTTLMIFQQWSPYVSVYVPGASLYSTELCISLGRISTETTESISTLYWKVYSPQWDGDHICTTFNSLAACDGIEPSSVHNCGKPLLTTCQATPWCLFVNFHHEILPNDILLGGSIQQDPPSPYPAWPLGLSTYGPLPNWIMVTCICWQRCFYEGRASRSNLMEYSTAMNPDTSFATVFHMPQ